MSSEEKDIRFTCPGCGAPMRVAVAAEQEAARVGQIADAHDVIAGAFDGSRKPRIYCFINGGKGTDWVRAMAMAEDGTCLAQHISSSDAFAKLDSGYADERFAEYYPDGYDLEWVDDPRSHPGLLAAYKLNQEKAKVLAPVPEPVGEGVDSRG